MSNGLKTIGLFGAAPDTGNQGVSALCYGTLQALCKGQSGTVHVFDHGKGIREFVGVDPPDGITIHRTGATSGKRIWRPEHYRRIDLGLALAPLSTEISKAVQSLDIILDLSGGDSFADLYGLARFNHVMRPKHLAMRLAKPLVLLPQTYGPFEHAACLRSARDAIIYAQTAWARDAQSFARLQGLLGSDFDPSRHRLGVDMAIGMQSRAPHFEVPPDWLEWLGTARTADDSNCVGINISGLIYNNSEAAKAQFGLSVEYRDVVRRLVETLVRECRTRVLLVPHVLTEPGQVESDIRACRELASALPAELTRHVAVAEGLRDARELKWLIAQLDWFCGTRLHATIAGLSKSVPTATLAYSLKAEGIFAAFAAADHCADMRTLSTEQALTLVLDSYANRRSHLPHLIAAQSVMMQRWVDQADMLNDILGNPNRHEAA